MRHAVSVTLRTGGWVPTAEDSPWHRLGEDRIRELVRVFYAVMASDEPALARLHVCDSEGRVDAKTQERFGLFLMGWLGGPQDYTEKHGHPRLRMRHGHVRIDESMRDAWLRCMSRAMDSTRVEPEVRNYLDVRFAEVAEFLRNA